MGARPWRLALALLWLLRPPPAIGVLAQESSDRTKRRRTQELRAKVPSNQLYFATKVSLQKEGKRAAANLVCEATSSSPSKPIKILQAYRKSSEGDNKVVPFTEDEALAHMLKCRLTKEAYKTTRLAMKERNADVFPSYEKRRAAKKRCYPPNSDIKITNLDAEADVTDDLNELAASFPPMDDNPPVHFATENSTVVTSQTGSTALVPCVVNNIGDGMVSWIRKKDLHLLTVGLTTYSSDERFQAIHLQHSEDWTLQIKYVQQRDAGFYECQVSSHPPTSILIQLNVVEARAEISGPAEKFLKPGSGLRLQCTVLQSTEPPSYVFWYHNNRMINYDRDRGVNVTTDLTEKTSTLSVISAATKHSGNYSCVPSNAQPASTYVHILNGENPAAMQHGGRGLSWLQCSPSSWLMALTFIAMYFS